MIELNEKVWVYGMWFVEGEDMNWLCCLRKLEDGIWDMTFRFRYFEDDKAFYSEDQKSWYSAQSKEPNIDPQTMIDAINKLASAVAANVDSTVDFIDLQCQGDNPKVMLQMGTRDWTQTKRASKEECDEPGKAR